MIRTAIMDYRTLDPSKLLWLRTARGLKVTYPGIKTLTIQTPRERANLVEPVPGLRNLEISFAEQCPSFSGFLKTCDDMATDRMTEWWPGARRIDTLRGWSDTWSLKDFGECLYFDADGNEMNTEPVGGYECSAVVKLTGTWTKGSEIWGMKWDVVQIKVHGPVIDDDEVEENEEVVEEEVDRGIFGFVDDDDTIDGPAKKRQRGMERVSHNNNNAVSYGFVDDDG